MANDVGAAKASKSAAQRRVRRAVAYREAAYVQLVNHALRRRQLRPCLAVPVECRIDDDGISACRAALSRRIERKVCAERSPTPIAAMHVVPQRTSGAALAHRDRAAAC